MAKLQPNGYIKYGNRELQATPAYDVRDHGYGGLGMLDSNDPAQSLGLLPGQTLSRRLFPDPQEREKQNEMAQIAMWLMGNGDNER